VIKRSKKLGVGDVFTLHNEMRRRLYADRHPGPLTLTRAEETAPEDPVVQALHNREWVVVTASALESGWFLSARALDDFGDIDPAVPGLYFSQQAMCASNVEDPLPVLRNVGVVA